jgi:hypothetical protein
MAGKKREDVREEDVTGLKYFDKLAPLLARLHDVGCQRDQAGNRTLHFDQYCMLVLLFLFNPVVRSLRAIEQASQLRKVQRKLGCQRASLGSLKAVMSAGCAIIAFTRSSSDVCLAMKTSKQACCWMRSYGWARPPSRMHGPTIRCGW